MAYSETLDDLSVARFNALTTPTQRRAYAEPIEILHSASYDLSRTVALVFVDFGPSYSEEHRDLIDLRLDHDRAVTVDRDGAFSYEEGGDFPYRGHSAAACAESIKAGCR